MRKYILKINFPRAIYYSKFLLPIFLLTISCISKSDLDSAKLSFFNSTDKKSFSFSVDEKFIKKHKKSRPSAIFPKMSISELRLLKRLLYNNKYCINEDNEVSFVIKSKQDKIYDITFSRLIEYNYDVKPVSPVTYFGECS